MLSRPLLKPEEAAAERIRREKARRSLTAFGEYVQPWWKPAPHHELVGKYLEEVSKYILSKGKEGIGRLMIMMPPRHGKTEEASRLFPAFMLGKFPDCRVIVTSYGADLAQESSRAVRNMVTSDRYRALFGDLSALDTPIELSDDSRAKSNWDLAAPHRGGVVAAGVGGGITGKGAHCLILDDPFKNREEAESQTQRENVMRWYRSSAYTRLEDGGAIVIMHTRWHREDLSGQLLKAMATNPMADRWTVVCLPALAYEQNEFSINEETHQAGLLSGLWMDHEDPLKRKPGEALWPAKYNEDALARMRENLEGENGPYEWWALYQQQPRPMEGGFFGVSDFGIVDEAPLGLRWVRYVDLALSDKKTADFNATIAIAMDKEGTVYLRDMARVRGWNEFRIRLSVMMVSDLERGTQWGIEDVAFQALAFQELLRDPSLANVAIRAIRPRGDKVERARPLQTRALAGKVKLVRGPWNRDFILEALDFPKGSHDDQIDTASGGLQMIAGMDRKREARMYSWTTAT